MLKITGGRDILHSDGITVEADGVCVTRDDGTVDLTLGLALLMAVYWIYGFQYPKSLKKTFAFLEKHIFEIPACKNTPVSVTRLFTDLTNKL